jgi:hypothetical protein
VIGGIVMAAGIVLLSRLDVDTTKFQLALFMVVLGTGMGFLMQTTMLIAQNSVEQKDLGVASSAATFFRSIGGSFGVALFGAIFVRSLKDDIAARLGQGAADQMTGGSVRVDPAMLDKLPPPAKEALLHGIASALSHVFVWAIPFAVIVGVLAVFIKEIPLRSGPTHEPADKPESEVPSAMVAALE